MHSRGIGRWMGLGIALAMASVLNMTTLAGPSAADQPPKGTPPELAKAYTAMHCRFGSLENSGTDDSKPKNIRLSCNTHRYGDFSIEMFQNVKLGRQWWLDYWLDGGGAGIAVKGSLVVTYQDYRGDDISPYDEEPTRWAAKRIGGRVIESH